MSQDVFQMHMEQITDSLLGILVIHNDKCIYGRNTEECARHLLQLMTIASQKDLVFNNSECSIWQPKIAFYRANFTAQGMKPDPLKVKALQDLPTSNNEAKLQSFLGLINYSQPFLLGLSLKTTFLREKSPTGTGNPTQTKIFTV